MLNALAADKKHTAGRLRWVLPTEDGVTVRNDVPMGLVEEVGAAVMQGISGTAEVPV